MYTSSDDNNTDLSIEHANERVDDSSTSMNEQRISHQQYNDEESAVIMLDAITYNIDMKEFMNEFNKYINDFDKLDNIIIYEFSSGGIGDYIKYYIMLLRHCIKYKIRLYFLKTNNPMEKYLILKNPKLYINEVEVNTLSENNMKFKKVLTWQIYMKSGIHINPDCWRIDGIILHHFYIFSDQVKNNSNVILFDKYPSLTNYVSIHLRLGDKHIEQSQDWTQYNRINDERAFNPSRIETYIEDNKEKQILFFCDSNKYKNNFKNEHSNIITTECDIGHTDSECSTEKQILDAVTEFYILSKSTQIVGASRSGYSEIASLFMDKRDYIRFF